MIYKSCLVLFSEIEKKTVIALCATLFFILYPFHHESLLWAVGRGSSLATLFAVLAIYLSLIRNPDGIWVITVSVLYFLSLSTYENTILVPLIVPTLLLANKRASKNWWKWSLIFLITALLNLLVRYYFVGLIVGDYGNRIFDFSPIVLVLKVFKASGRFILPPGLAESWMIIFSLIAGIVLLFFSIRLLKHDKSGRGVFFSILISFGLSFVLPSLFGISTRTLEGDRLYYFPSFYFSILLAYSLVQLCSSVQLRWATSLLLGYFLFCLHNSNKIWKKADEISKVILDDMVAYRSKADKMYVVNLPEEYFGAHVFRNGFPEALILRGVDTTGIVLLSLQGPSQQLILNEVLKPVIDSSGSLLIGLNTVFLNRSTVLSFNRETKIFEKLAIDSTATILYWNNRNLELMTY
ncbi:hypothetical protein [Flavihumibacter cheonanensis]|uniref:hypothetical protein n=1 Tax=Flavihumibacter cheonanensis TaxID=1442385 RepID=UPI001EF8716B|nr:hypothetical protein [Flavihumibacter cheonanensis]MCG7750822.1 hypothetical protein [Flavihumibacter cheonanensis]